MADETANLLLEMLRAIRAEIANLTLRSDNLAAEVRSVKGHVATLVTSDFHRDERFAALDTRLDRIERRLELIN